MATLQELENALRKADAAGNVDDARALANAIRQARARPDFSNVQAGVRTTESTGNANDSDFARLISGTRRPEPTIAGERAGDIPAWKQAAYGLVSPIASAITGVGQMTGLMDDKQVSESQARIDSIRGTLPGGVAGVVGDVGSMALPLSKVGQLPKMGQYAASALAGSTFAGLQPVREGESRQENMAIGGGLGVLGQGTSDVLIKAGKRAASAISPQVRELYEAAKARGITLTPAQLSDSKALKFLQSQLSRLPIIGGSGKLAQQRAVWNQELAKTIGEEAPVVTPEVFSRAKLRHSSQFEALTDRNALKVDDRLLKKLADIEQQAQVAGGQTLSDVRAAIDDFYQRAVTGKDGIQVPGAAYQAFDSQLGQITKLGTPSSHFVGRVRSAVRGAMDDSISPADREAWKKLRQEYGNRKTIRDLVGKGDGGEISPAALMGRVTANNAGKESMATGSRGSLGELARIGQRLKEPPSSGTAERLMSVAAGAGAVTNLPLTLGALLAGGATKKALDSSLLARLLMREGRGRELQAVAPYVRAAAPVAPVASKKRSDESRKRK